MGDHRLQLPGDRYKFGIKFPAGPKADDVEERQNPTARMSGESNSDVDDFYPGSPYCGEPSVLSFTNLFA